MTVHSSHNASTEVLSCDLLIVGGGIVGLWLARFAVAADLRVVLCDRRVIGSGASGGFLGALMPHVPERWNPKKQFQLEALGTLGEHVAALEAETGLSTGYRRIGRLMPLLKPHHRALATDRTATAAEMWRTAATGFEWRLIDGPSVPDWPAASAMPHGLVHETLAARIDPRRLVAALKTALRNLPSVRLIEDDGVASLEPDGAVLEHGERIAAGRIVVTAGHESFAMLDPLAPGTGRSLGQAVKGQAALLRLALPEDWPMVFHNGVYVVPHEDGLVAVGSTSENTFAAPFTTDEKLDGVLARATKLCPALAGAEIVERWAGLRPKAIGGDPMIGAMPGSRRIIAATGGFKITLGVAHKMAEKALAMATGVGDASVPESFRVETHIAKARFRENFG